nr:hypothetical protein [Tanacetum cinerariifolium]
MVNLPTPNNDPNVSEGDQAPTAPDVFAPQWIGKHDLNNNNRWIEWEVPLGGEVDEPMGPSDAPRATVTVSSTYEVGGPSTAAVEGPSFLLPAPGLPVPPTVIEDLSTCLGNLEYRHGVLMRKMEELSDAKVADIISIGEIHHRVATVEEQTRVAEMESHVGILMSYMLWMEERLTVLEKRLPGPPSGPQ